MVAGGSRFDCDVLGWLAILADQVAHYAWSSGKSFYPAIYARGEFVVRWLVAIYSHSHQAISFRRLDRACSGQPILVGQLVSTRLDNPKEHVLADVLARPGLKPNTLVLMNDGALNYYADNSLAAALNWIYDPNNHAPAQIHYALFFPTNRIGNNLPALQAGLPIQYNYLVGMFNGNTSQVVAFYYQPPGCLRVLDPEIDCRIILFRLKV